MSQAPTPDSPSESNSANNATPEPRFLLNLKESGSPAFVGLKCNANCKQVTQHTFIKVEPYCLEGPLDPMETLKMTKRLILCTMCGNLKLTN